MSRFDGEAWTTFTTDDGLADDVVRSIVVDNDGTLWFGTHEGVSSYDGEKWTTYTVQDGLAHDVIQSAVVDAGGTVWFGTQERCLKL